MSNRSRTERPPGDLFAVRSRPARRTFLRMAGALLLMLVGLCCAAGLASAHPGHGRALGHTAAHGNGHSAAAHAAPHPSHAAPHPSHAAGHSHGVGHGGTPPGHAKPHPGNGRCPTCAVTASASHATSHKARAHHRHHARKHHRRRHHAARRTHRHRTAAARRRARARTSRARRAARRRRAAAGARHARAHHRAAPQPASQVQKPPAKHPPSATGTPVLLRFVNRIPWYVWLIVAGALLLAAIVGASAARTAVLARRQKAALAAVTAEALIDPLTGVLNRRGFTDAAERELARAQRYGRPFALAYADVRGLKGVNDTQGHLAGDNLIRNATSVLQDSARADDIVGRLGGDEFGLLLVEQTHEGAEVVISRIRERLAAERAEMGADTPWDLTIGTAAYPEDGSDIPELLRAADRRMYEQRGITLS